jgi:hypothetical protein
MDPSPAVTHRGLLLAAPVGAIAGVLAIMSTPVMSAAGPVPASILEPSVTDTPVPTDTAAPTPAPDPVLGVQIVASDLSLDNEYWQGSGGHGAIRFTVTNTGDASQWTVISYTLPAGVHAASECACSAAVPAGQGWTTSVAVSVDPDAWRHAPLVGSATATSVYITRPDIPAAGDTDGFSILLPPGPPIPGIVLTAADVVLGAQRPTGLETARLGVRLVNSGSAPADGAVEVTTPEGVDIVTFPTDCASHRMVEGHRQRCELGKLPAGQARALTFGLSLTASARANAPLSGAVHAFLTPTGQNTAEVQTIYRVLVGGAGTAPTAVASGDVPDSASQAAGGGADGPPVGTGPEHVIRDNFLSDPIAVLPVVGLVVGLAAIVGLFVVLSLRRRLQDDIQPLPSTDRAAD